ncbi:MAG: glycerol-3-phosphate 1-O-acyltransferase PlsY [Bacteroidales bacterium]
MEFGVGIVLAALGAYLLGSIPTAVWIGKSFYGIDVREHGSGNAGATNALRVLGNKVGIVVLLLDALKGVAAVSLALLVQEKFQSPDLFVLFQLVLGALALTGHVYPVFASFRGGKGIATLAGIITILLPLAVLICLGVFLLVFIPTRYVSLGSLSAALAFPVAVIWILDINLLPVIVFSIMVAIFVVLTHLKNIKRLLHGRENKISFRKKA